MPIIASNENEANLIGRLPLYLAPDEGGFCGVSLNKSHYNQNVLTVFISLSELLRNLEQEQKTWSDVWSRLNWARGLFTSDFVWENFHILINSAAKMSCEHFNPTAHMWLKLVLQAASQTDHKMSSITHSRFIKILNDSTTRHHMKQFITTLKKIHKTS